MTPTPEKSCEEIASNIVVKGNHQLAEIIAKRLFSIETCPPDEQRKMVVRTCRDAVAYHEKILLEKQKVIDELSGEVEKLQNDNSNYRIELNKWNVHAGDLHSKSEELVKILKKIGDGDYSYGYCIRAAQEVIAKVRGGV